METKEPQVEVSEGSEPINDYYFHIMRYFIPDFWYLENKRWFGSNIELQNKLLLIIRLGLHGKVYVATPDLDEHLDFLLSQYYDLKDNF